MYFAAADATVSCTDPRIEQTQVIVNFCLGAHRRSWIASRVLLPHSNCRSNTPNFVDIRLVHPLKKLPGICRQGFNITALSLRIDRVEGQGRFSRPTNAGNHGELIYWDRERDVLEVVDPGPPDLDIFFRHTLFAGRRHRSESDGLCKPRIISRKLASAKCPRLLECGGKR